MSSRSKGMETERKAQKELEENRWLVYRVKGSTMYNKNCDIFGLFDLLAIKLTKYNNCNAYPQIRKWIQVKTNALPNKIWKNDALTFKINYCDNNDSIEFWTFWKRGKRKNKKGFEKILI